MKRLLYITQYYASKNQPGASRHYQHIQMLMRWGYEVTLITSYVKNRLRVIPPEYEHAKIVEERDGDLQIFKTYAYPNYGRDFKTRMMNYLSFLYYSVVAGFRSPSCDIVLASSPSLFVGLSGYLVSRIKRVPFVFEVRDLWPETAVVMGALNNPFAVKLAAVLAHFLYKKADRIIAVTQGIYDGILAYDIDEEKLSLIPNGVDDDLYAQLDPQKAAQIREEYGWQDKFVAIYAGTLARSDGLETVVHTAATLTSYEDIHIAFIGDGEMKAKLSALTEKYQLSSVQFIPSQPKSRIPDFVGAADVCLMPVKGDDFFKMTLPNKLFDYMAGASPVIASVPDGEAQKIVEEAEAGLVIPPEDEISLATALLELREQPDLRQTYGQNGRTYALKYYLRSILATRLAHILDTLLDENSEVVSHEIETEHVSNI